VRVAALRLNSRETGDAARPSRRAISRTPSPVQARARSPPARPMPESAPTAASTMAQMSKRACHQPPETNGSQPAATPPRRSPRPRLIDQPLSTPKGAADPHVAPSPAARATSTCPVTLDPTAVSLPSQHSSRLCCDDHLIPPDDRSAAVLAGAYLEDRF